MQTEHGTVRLYDEKPYDVTFEAKVLSCEEKQTGEKTSVYQVILDRTLFFPEEGGQSPDKGTLGGVPVLDVQIADDVITHTLERPLAPGETVRGELDWQHRFSNMQQHTGEHIFSGIVHSRYGLENVGFHLSDSVVTMDYNGVLSEEQLAEVEWEANRAIARDLPVEVSWPTKEEEQRIEYRSKKEIEGQLRIVTIPGYDVCACCAPHVRRTGEVGMLKIMQVQHYKGGVRLSILCGFRALLAFRRKAQVVSELMHSLSSDQEHLAENVRKLQEEREQWKLRFSEAKWQNLEGKLTEFPAEEEARLIFDRDLDEMLMRRAVNKMTEECGAFCGVFCGNSDGSYRFVIGSSQKDCRAAAQMLRQELGAKGGGSSRMIQGSIAAAPEEIRSLLERIA